MTSSLWRLVCLMKQEGNLAIKLRTLGRPHVLYFRHFMQSRLTQFQAESLQRRRRKWMSVDSKSWLHLGNRASGSWFCPPLELHCLNSCILVCDPSLVLHVVHGSFCFKRPRAPECMELLMVASEREREGERERAAFLEKTWTDRWRGNDTCRRRPILFPQPRNYTDFPVLTSRFCSVTFVLGEKLLVCVFLNEGRSFINYTEKRETTLQRLKLCWYFLMIWGVNFVMWLGFTSQCWFIPPLAHAVLHWNPWLLCVCSAFCKNTSFLLSDPAKLDFKSLIECFAS